MIVVGITGGIGTGKSTVGKYILSKGFPFISSDLNAKTIMNSDPELQKQLVTQFGEKVLADGFINSPFLAEKLFGDTNEKNRNFVNNLVHPKTISLMMEQVEAFEEKGESIVFVESALLYEVSLEDGFDYIIVVDAKEEIRIERTLMRSKETREQIVERINAQLSQKWKVQQADFVLENNKGIEDLYRGTDFLLSFLPSLPPKSFENPEEEE